MKDFKLTLSSLGYLVTILTELLKNNNKSYRVSIKEWRESRSLSQNALYWKWLTEISKQSNLEIKGSKFKSEELWHEVFKKYYCAEKTITDGKVNTIVKSTKLLDVGEMTFYLSKIESWCIDRGIKLTIPIDSEYYNYINSQNN